MLEIIRDMRYALRTLRKTPAVTITAVLTLALGIGATTAIFTVFDAVLLRPLPYPDAGRLYVIHEKSGHSAALIPVNALHFREWRGETRAFENMALIGPLTVTLTSGVGEPLLIPAARATPSLFRTLGVEPELGRAFLDEEDVPGRDGVVILGYGLWATRFGADPSVVGRTVLINGAPNVVVGVLPARFTLSKLSHLYALDTSFDRPQLWKPFAAAAADLRPLSGFNNVAVARLKAETTASHALDELNAVQAVLAANAPEAAEFHAAIVPMADQIVSKSKTALQLVFFAAAMVLIITCLNTASLMITRAERRRQEFAIRRAAGANGRRLTLQILAESLVLSMLAGSVGLIGGIGIVRLIQASSGVDVPRMDEVSINLGVVLFTFAVTFLSGLLIGAVPAWCATRAADGELLRSCPATISSGKSSWRACSLLVSIEVAASAACLVFGALLLGSFVKLLTIGRGFDTERIVTIDFVLPRARYNEVAGVQFLASLADRARALPGVSAAGVTDVLPLGGVSSSAIMVKGTNLPRTQRPVAMIRLADRGYFETLNIKPQAGRLLDEADGGRHVAVVSALAAQRLWPDQDPLGKQFRHGADDSPWVEIVGVVNDVRAVSLSQDPPLSVYLPLAGNFYGPGALAVSTKSNPFALAAALRGIVRELDPQLPVPTPKTLDDIVRASVASRRFQMNLVLLLAALATFLAGIGIYGTVSYTVAQRTSELGIRMALGARPGQIRWMVLAQGLRPVAAGMTAGFAASMATGGMLSSLLFGVSTTDGTILAMVGLFLGVIALLASDVPARRATRVDPIVALRAQ